MSWIASWTKIKRYDVCPHQFYLVDGSAYIHGKPIIPFVTSPALERGKKIHDLYEKAGISLTNGNPIPEKYKQDSLWNPYIGQMLEVLFKQASLSVCIERMFGVDQAWKVWSLNEYWQPDKNLFGNNQLLIRAKIDLALFSDCPNTGNPTYGAVIDYKSGKVREPDEQLALYAAIAFARWSSLQMIDCMYLYVDHDKEVVSTYQRSHFGMLKTFFNSKIAEIQRELTLAKQDKDYQWRKREGNCHWCPATPVLCDYKRG